MAELWTEAFIGMGFAKQACSFEPAVANINNVML